MGASYLNPKAKVLASSIHKRGLFAKEIIRKGEIIAVPGGGCVVTEAELDRELKNLPEKHFKILKDHLIKLAPGLYMIHANKDKLYGDDYLNHSCEPNIGIKGSILFVAMRDIRVEEELTYDYAMTDNDPGVYFKCHCQEKNCRNFITGDDWKNPELQRKYKGYFAWHVQEEIKKFTKNR